MEGSRLRYTAGDTHVTPRSQPSRRRTCRSPRPGLWNDHLARRCRRACRASGQTYYFCSQSCLDQFRSTPDAFLAERPAGPIAPADMEREYTCPMDPEVRQKGPGACPKCGMALEPVTVAPVTKTEWTCPMHPEIVRDAPGPCPICGMALEPRRRHDRGEQP